MVRFVPDLVHLDRGDGVCVHLTEDKLCGVYEDRPDICNTRTTFDRKWSEVLSWDEYLDASERMCKVLDNLVNDAGHDVVLE